MLLSLTLDVLQIIKSSTHFHSCIFSRYLLRAQVGRGDVISEATLVNALTNGWLSAAVLDVFEVRFRDYLLKTCNDESFHELSTRGGWLCC